jgi:hypothetical protein
LTLIFEKFVPCKQIKLMVKASVNIKNQVLLNFYF